MMRSTPTTKMAKPPPPVPPRPSKTMIAEALAKSKKPPVDASVPLRMAPPPPVVEPPPVKTRDPEAVAKSKSHSAVNVMLKKPSLDRSISEEVKTTSRTVVFQSSNMKCSKIQVNSLEDSELTKSSDSIKSGSDTCADVSEDVSTNKCGPGDDSSANKLDKNWNEILNNRNHVNTLIDEMFASVLEIPDDKLHDASNESVSCNPDKVHVNSQSADDKCESAEKEKEDCKPTVLVINDESEQKNSIQESKSNSSTAERRVKFDDKMNHELLISELQNMKKEQDRILKRQRKPSQELYEDVPRIYHSDWVEVNNGEEVRLSSCQITIEDFKNNKDNADGSAENILSRLAAMSSLHGLPPLPKSLSGFSLQEDLTQIPNRPGSSRGPTPPAGHHVYPPHPKPTMNGTDAPTGRSTTNLDSQLAILRREMVSLLYSILISDSRMVLVA